MKAVLGIFSLVLFFLSSVVQAACWEKQEYREIENYSELDDKLILSFKDAVSCEAIDGIKVQLGSLTYKTDLSGYVTLPMAPFIQAGNLKMPMKVTKDGYTTINTKLKVVAGTVLNKRMLLSPSLDGNSMRFILQWNDEPKDLDLHLEGEGFHVSYRNKRSHGQAKLDQDEQAGFGPETITLREVKTGGRYKVSVVNYSSDADMDDTAKVLVYVGDKLDRVIALNETAERKVAVLEINNGQLSSLIPVSQKQNEILPGW